MGVEFASLNGCIYNKAELCSDLGLDADIRIEDFLIAAWNAFGEGITDQLDGEFACRFYDADNKVSVLITDAIGSRPIYYAIQDQKCYSGFSPNDLLSNSDLTFSKNTRWIAEFLVGMPDSVGANQTAYNEMYKMPPASIAIVADGRLQSLTQYEDWDYRPSDIKQSDDAWVNQHRGFFEKALIKRSSGKHLLAAENSGGLDSGSIITFLGKIVSKDTSKKLRTIGTLRWESENHWIPLVNETAGVTDTSLVDSYWNVPTLLQFEQEVKGYPMLLLPEVAHSELMRAQEDDVKVIFSGFGGDEAVTQFGEEFSQEAFRNMDFMSLWRMIGGHPLKKPYRFLRLVWAKGVQKNLLEITIRNLVDSSYLGDPALLKNIRTTHSKDMSRDKILNQSLNGSVRRALLHRPVFQLRMEEHSLAGLAFGMNYSWPLLDRALLSNFMKTPSLQRVKPGKVERYLHRRAVRGVLPSEIIDTNTKIMGDIALSAESFRTRHTDIMHYAQVTLDSLAEPLASIVDQEKIADEIDKFSTYTDLGPQNEVIFFWHRMRRLISLNHWCIHGR